MQPIRVVTYNVHAWRGLFGQPNVERVVRVLQTVKADIIGLQEVTFGEPGRCDALAALGEAFPGFALVRGATLRRRNAHFGNVLMSRYPIEACDCHDISLAGREPRGLIDALLSVGGRGLRVGVTHFGRSPLERAQQAKRCVRLWAGNLGTPLVVLSDFNEWLPLSASFRLFWRFFQRGPSPRTFPARFPLLSLDRIWVTPLLLLRKLFVLRSPEARATSDHLPLIADIEIVGAGADTISADTT